jgi:nucleotide-binding universal stress UspA family protein
MKRFKNILYFADRVSESCPALQRATALARSNQARLTVVDVIEDSAAVQEEVAERFHLDLGRLIRERREEELEQLIAPYQDPESVIYTQVYSGIPFVEVIRAVLRNGFDLVIKAARPPAGLSERLFGSSDLHLLRKCPCPVWIDRPGEVYPYRKILAAVDPLDQEAVGTDRLVMDLATSLAEQESARLSVLHAWQLEGETMLRGGRSPLPQSEVDLLVANEREKHVKALHQLTSHYTLESDQIHLVKGVASNVIHSEAEQQGADLIVMGTLGRTGIPGFFIGNTAEEVLQSAKAAILAVKPAGFESPVKA